MQASNLLNFKSFFFSIFFFPLYFFPLNRQALGRSSLRSEVSGIMMYLANKHNVEKPWKIFSYDTEKNNLLFQDC